MGRQVEVVSVTIRPQCIGEPCSVCGAQAEHKIAEEFQFDDPLPTRHPCTAYVCGECFRQIFMNYRSAG